MNREKALEEALRYGITVVCNAYVEETGVTREDFETARKKFLEEAHAALYLPSPALPNQE